MTTGKTNRVPELEKIAAEAFAALDTNHQIASFSARVSGFNLDDAYRVAATIRRMREKQGKGQRVNLRKDRRLG